MIVLHLEAATFDDLLSKVVDELGSARLAAAMGFGRLPPPPEREEAKATPEPTKRPVGRPRKVQPDPVPEIDPDPKPGWVRLGPDRQPEAVEEPVDEAPFEVAMPEPNGAGDPIALEKLKQETVAKLPDMFAAGKVNLMRAVLTKYGKGAKSFPEIEAKDFPEIAAALARGDGS